jgi:hypothetical protein
MRTSVTVFLLLAAGAGSAPAQVGETPEQVTDRFIAAMRAGDWHGMASLMHPAALREMRELMGALFEAPDADQIRQQLLGVSTAADARALSDTAVFASVMRSTTKDPTLGELLKSAHVTVLGRVNEGADTTHVVYRMAMTIEGISITRMDVMSLARSPRGWRGLLKGDVSALAAAIRAAIERQ